VVELETNLHQIVETESAPEPPHVGKLCMQSPHNWDWPDIRRSDRQRNRGTNRTVAVQPEADPKPFRDFFLAKEPVGPREKVSWDGSPVAKGTELCRGLELLELH